MLLLLTRMNHFYKREKPGLIQKKGVLLILAIKQEVLIAVFL